MKKTPSTSSAWLPIYRIVAYVSLILFFVSIVLYQFNIAYDSLVHLCGALAIALYFPLVLLGLDDTPTEKTEDEIATGFFKSYAIYLGGSLLIALVLGGIYSALTPSPTEEILDGSENQGSFSPNEKLTVKEGISLLLQHVRIPENRFEAYEEIPFEYIPLSDEHYMLFKTAYYQELINATVDPNVPLTTKQAVIILGQLENWRFSSLIGKHRDYIEHAIEIGILASDETELLNEIITRGELAKMFDLLEP